MANITNSKTWLITSLFLIVLCQTAVTVGKVIYVDVDARGANTGTSWEDAYQYLQDALADANSAGKPAEIRVAKGVYRPDRGAGVTPGSREATFQLINGVALKGGYAGFDESDPNAREVELYETILGGDLNGDDVEVINARDLAVEFVDISYFETEPTRAENSYHVVTGSGTDETAIIDGFTITAGYANDFPNGPQSKGGGMHNNQGSPTITYCTFTLNASFCGGGIYNKDSNPNISNCCFKKNFADTIDYPWDVITFITGGGGIGNEHSSPTLRNCIFEGNYGLIGGGIYNSDGNNSNLTNCTFTGNRAGAGGGIYGSDFVTLTNCIFWDNEPTEYFWIYNISYSNIIGGWALERGNIVTDPLFAKPGRWADKNNPDIIAESNDPNAIWIDGDYHLKSQGGRWDPDSKSWVVDDVTSPCIDSGDPNNPVGDEPMHNRGVINMGAYGGTSEASKSPTYVHSNFKASNPNPADRSYYEGEEITLSWTAGLNAVSHNVYFGASIPLPFIGNQTETEFEPDVLEYGTTHFWRIDEVTSEGVTTGDIWRFTMTTPVPPPKGRGCFTGETGVWVDGALVPISEAAAGQNVGNIKSTTCEGSLVKLPCLGRIEKLEEHEGTFACYDILLESGNRINAAECHYFLAESGRWVALQNLKTGMKLRTAKGTVGIVSVTKRPEPCIGKVYNIKVKGSDRYMVGEDAVIVRDY